ncbi:SDR family NAD(P)-dependent oxidoreductase [Pontibacter diazotrophicus]|uniref:SDR family NAD(P)-dependent oxidoreductase n=1 Tax=Pontibacter diazotrophicus TaxID=1400979 RepID=A0A3D8LGI7_9BACT|nr:SDR family NAD(P)-dependent oxidoreductase [Pontibacter diazotrophicus]RDV16515.1 SDR family NAD(P)-dependent oxidoreductase [Pontibacter diazotrophicus]
MTNEVQKAIITGASNGIGRFLTEKLLNEGIHVIAVTRSGKIENYSHPNLTVVQGDISDEASINKAIEQIGEVSNQIDYLINNAGVGPDLGDEVPTADHLKTSFSVNTTGTVLFTEGVLNYLKDGAHIVFLSTAMALIRNAGPNGPAYRMSKAAINMYAVILAQRLAEKSIRVTPLHPGWVQTRMGGENAPVTVEQSVTGIYKALTENTESGKFWNIEVGGLEEY